MFRCLLTAAGCLAVTWVLGCGSTRPGADEPALLDEDPSQTSVARSDTESDAPTTDIDDADRADDGLASIPRAALVRVLDAGPGAFLAMVRVEPYFDKQRWAGWRVSSLDAAYQRAGIRPGDVVVRVNGSAIMRPEQLFEVFKALRTADTLVVTGQRDGAPLELRFPIQGGPAPAPATAGEQK